MDKGFAMGILGYLIIMGGAVCGIIILIHAFKESVGQGLLCFCVPIYILYYAFVRFEHPKKNLIIGLWLGCFILGGALLGMSMGAAVANLQ